MKRIAFFSAAAVAFLAASCSNAPEETVETKEKEEVKEPEHVDATFAMDTEGDEIKWVGFKTISNDKHNGTLQVKSGEFNTHNGEIVGGTFVMDMTTIDDLSAPEEGDYNQAKLEGHLKSADFFHVEEHPEATFTITGISKADDNEEGSTHNISGNLMMRGKENNITFPAKVKMTDDMIKMSTPEFAIDRTKWEVMAMSTVTGFAKDKAIDNNLLLQIDLKAKKG